MWPSQQSVSNGKSKLGNICDTVRIRKSKGHGSEGDRRDEEHDDLQKYREQSEALPVSPETSIQYTLVREAEHAHTREDPYGCISVSGFPFIADMDRFPERGKRFFYGPLCVRSQSSTVIATHQAQTPELRVQIPQGLLMGYSYNG